MKQKTRRTSQMTQCRSFLVDILFLAICQIGLVGSLNAQVISSLEGKTFVYRVFYDDTMNPGFKFSFGGGKLQIDIPEMDEGKIEGGSFIERTATVPYSLRRDGKFLFAKTDTREYLVLAAPTDVCLLIDTKSGVSYWGVDKNSPSVLLSNGSTRSVKIGIEKGRTGVQKYSSFLQTMIFGSLVTLDGVGKYYYDYYPPWVTSDKGTGVGEWTVRSTYRKVKQLVLVNGFIHPDRLEYFDDYSRAKIVRIDSSQGHWDFSLEDSPDPQILNLPMQITGDIKLSISEIYRGKRTSAVAIAGIYFLY